MIENFFVINSFVVLHNAEEYNYFAKKKSNYTESDLLDLCSETYNTDDICEVKINDDGMTCITVLNEDRQGGSHEVILLDDYNEVKETLENMVNILKQERIIEKLNKKKAKV